LKLYGFTDITGNSSQLPESSQELKNIPLPAPPPGAPVQANVNVPDHLPDGSWNTYNGQPIHFRQNERGQRELPGGKGGQRFIPPNEYKEFLQLGHGGIFDLNLDSIDVWPWRERGCDLEAYFNYGFNERTWRKYTTEIRKARLDMHLKNQIETTTEASIDFDLPVEVRKVLHSHVRMENSDLDRRALQEAKFTGEKSDLAALSNSVKDAGFENRRSNDNFSDSLRGFQQETESLQIRYTSFQDDGDVIPDQNRTSKLRLLEIQQGIMEVLTSGIVTPLS
jgi:hypothetical protein